MIRFIKEKLNNYYLIEKQKKSRKIVLKGFPYWLTVDPTNYCNLQCPLCPTGQKRGSRPANTLSFKTFKKIIDILGPYLIHIDFCNWGEPLLNEGIYDMIAYAKKFSIHTKLDTNFNVFSEEEAEKLIDSGLDKIILSIDGASQKTYSKYRKGGDLKKVLENVKLLINKKKEIKSSKPIVEWQFLVFKHNEHEIEKARELAHELGVDEINFTPPYAGSQEWLTTLEPFRSKYYEVISDKVEFKKSAREAICNWLWDAVTINSDGSISPCCSVEDARDDFLARFNSRSFSKGWNCEKYIKARQHVINSKEKIINDPANICLRCDHIGLSNHVDIEYMIKDIEDEH